MEFRLPELGEGIADAVVTTIAVKAGDSVEVGQTLVEVETDKASMPVPATAAGTIGEISVKAGQRIKVGAVLLTFHGNGAPAPATPKPAPTPAVAPAPAPMPSASSTIDFKVPALGEGIDGGTIVGISVNAGDTVAAGQECFTIETDKASMPLTAPSAGVIGEVKVKSGQKVTIGSVVATMTVAGGSTPAPVVSAPPKPTTNGTPAPAPKAAPVAVATAPTPEHLPVPAGPATRRFARELGVNLRSVSGSARGGRVTVDDVKGFVRETFTRPGGVATSAGPVAPPLPDFSKYGPVERLPLSNLRKKIAENLTHAWHVAPAVTQFDLADITELEAGRKRTVEAMPKGSPKVTMTVLAVKAVVSAMKEFPNFNSALDLASGELVKKGYYHIGIAVDTERGLVVPVIRDADKKSIRDLAKDVAELADKARAGKLTIDDMRGGCLTITNLGGVGGTAFTPIINVPEVAILGMARSALQPIVRNGAIEPRLMLPLCLTYDHRVIDGADGARFTTRLVQLFSDPIRLLMES